MKKLIFLLVLAFPLILQGQIRVEQIRSTGATSGQVATADGSGGTSWQAVPISVTSVNSQTGAVVLNAGNLSFTPNGSISSTNVQAAIQEVRDEAASSTAPPQTITYSATATHNFTSGATGVITLTGNVTTYTLSNIPDNGSGGIIIIQNATGGYGIAAIAHSGLVVNYIDGSAPTATNINSVANGHTVLNYWRVGSYLYVTFGKFGASL